KGMCLTVKGRSRVEELKGKHQFLREPAFFNGFDLKGWEKQFYLLVQVASELSYQNNKYFAIINDFKTQQLFKNWFRRYGKATLLREITTSLTDFLAHEPKLNAQLFCEQLTGHGRLGQTKAQLAERYQIQVAEIEVGWRDLCARYAKYLLEHNFELAKLVMHYKRLTNLPASTEKTYTLFLEGKSIEEIANLRRIQKSTVQEHLLNVAILTDDFPKERLLSPKLKKQIVDFFADCTVLNWKFQQLHESYPEISFFEYRLCQIERIIAGERKA
ncbi:helix-turn-helix domain-containing protein, partial [uncultured Ligilactobacillus sp.]